MQVEITARHGSVSETVRSHINEKSQKLLTYFERVTAIQVTIDFEKDRAGVEILVDTEHKHNFVARDVGDGVLATFDSALHKMEQQIRKYKQKIQDHRRDVPMNELVESGLDAEEDEEETDEPEIKE